MFCQQRSCLKGSLQDQGHRPDIRPCCWSGHWVWRRGKGCQGNCLRFQGQASQQGPGSTAEPSAVSFQRPAEVLPMWKGPQSNGLPLQRSQVPFESCLPDKATSRTGALPTTLWRGSQKLNLWKQASVKFLKILLVWMCPSQSRTVSSPWNWTLPLREILCLCRSGNN